MEYLFLASIGPVQGFIASARRSRDLYFGSWLLSELAKAAAKEIADNDESGINSLIFPAPANLDELNPDTPLNVANKIVAKISGQPHDTGTKVKDAIFNRLNAIIELVYGKLEISDEDRETAVKQIHDLVEYFWVAVPFTGSYADARESAEALMAARKNTRDFAPVTWGNHRSKSSIDGQLESVIPESYYPNQKDQSAGTWGIKAKVLYDKFGAGAAERLSGVDILKRKGEPISSPNFPSTSHVATIPFLKRLETINGAEKIQAKQQWRIYIQHVKKISEGFLEHIPSWYPNHPILGDLEGSLLFEERLVDLLDLVQVEDTDQFIVSFNNAKKALRVFYALLNEVLGKARPDPYYVILQADGDRMGKTIDMLAKEGENKHRELSQALDTFARSVKTTVEEGHQGALIYAGGDDVLAFLPLHTALQCAKKLADDFKQGLNKFKDEKGVAPTLSVGLAIVHHLHPLWDALNIARAAEKRAKDTLNKNRLAITVRKRSGGEYTLADSWNSIYTDLETLIADHKGNTIPYGTAYELKNMIQHLSVAPSDPGYHSLENGIRAEAKRILERKLGVTLHKEGATKPAETLEQLLGMIEERNGDRSISVRIEHFINMLLVAKIFADARKLTEPKKKEEVFS